MTPTPYSNSKGSFLFVPVPDDAIDFTFYWNHEGVNGSYLVYDRPVDKINKPSDIQICLDDKYYNEGDLKLLGCTDAEDFPCEEVVDKKVLNGNNYHRRYDHKKKIITFPDGDSISSEDSFVYVENGDVFSAKESFQSLMKSLGLEGRFYVLRKL